MALDHARCSARPHASGHQACVGGAPRGCGVSGRSLVIDGGLRGVFRDRLRVGIHWQSIETGGTGRGIPDSNFCGEDVGEGWIEFKQTSAWSVGLAPEQVGWLKKRILCGGRTFVAVRRSHEGGPRRGSGVDELWLCSGVWAGHLRTDGLRCPEVQWLGVWSGGPSSWNWEEVRRCLQSGRD